MGDRGGTATVIVLPPSHFHYTRWEIGGEPQPPEGGAEASIDYTRWEIGGEPQPSGRDLTVHLNYTRWEIGGEPQLESWETGLDFIIPDGRSGGNRNMR